tara:strand:+ start:45 stop:356 length:312 start_codon:yes stop_codon:yes gene_type:complete
LEKESFKQECTRQLITYFQLLHKNNLDTELKQRVQGFINAGEFLNVITRADAIQLMDDAHLSVFGVTNEQRKERKAEIKAVRSGHEDSIFEIPAYDRLIKRSS